MSPAIVSHQRIGINEYICTWSAAPLWESWLFLAYGSSHTGGLWGPQRGWRIIMETCSSRLQWSRSAVWISILMKGALGKHSRATYQVRM